MKRKRRQSEDYVCPVSSGNYADPKSCRRFYQVNRLCGLSRLCAYSFHIVILSLVKIAALPPHCFLCEFCSYYYRACILSFTFHREGENFPR